VSDPYWNHNVHYHRVVLAAVPDGCRSALDVGCGDGLLARKLASQAGSVTGVDRSPDMIRLARQNVPGNVTLLEGDYLDSAALREGGYDFVSAVAVVHHTVFEDAVGRLVRLLAPGARLVIVGLAYNRTFLDWVISGWGVPASRFHALLRGESAVRPVCPSRTRTCTGTRSGRRPGATGAGGTFYAHRKPCKRAQVQTSPTRRACH
jgi:2-polyprenyl-3-methyl-5-hydroxy-6-metoxy-1,4-benzoquinol methylase